MYNHTSDLLFCFGITGSVALNGNADAAVCYVSGNVRRLFTVSDRTAAGGGIKAVLTLHYRVCRVMQVQGKLLQEPWPSDSQVHDFHFQGGN